MTTGTALYLARRRARVSAADVARHLGASRQYVSKVEQKTDAVPPETVSRYREALLAATGDETLVSLHVAMTGDYAEGVRTTRGRLKGIDRDAVLLIHLNGKSEPALGLLATVDTVASQGRRCRGAWPRPRIGRYPGWRELASAGGLARRASARTRVGPTEIA